MAKARAKENTGNSKTRNIIEDYYNYASRIYAGITYEGLSLDKIANKFEIQPICLDKYKPICELKDSISQKHFETDININKEMK